MNNIINYIITFAETALFMASVGYATLATGALPKWSGWVSYASTHTLPCSYSLNVQTRI
jgi:hypothetical protein